MTETNTQPQLKVGDRKFFGFSEVEVVAVVRNPYNDATHIVLINHTEKKFMAAAEHQLTDTPEMFVEMSPSYDVEVGTNPARRMEQVPKEPLKPLVLGRLTKTEDGVNFEVLSLGKTFDQLEAEVDKQAQEAA